MRSLLIISGLLIASTGFSQDAEADVKIEYQKKTVIDFSDVNIEGELKKPEGSYIQNRKRTKFRNLIELRGNFRPELRRSVSAL